MLEQQVLKVPKVVKVPKVFRVLLEHKVFRVLMALPLGHKMLLVYQLLHNLVLIQQV